MADNEKRIEKGTIYQNMNKMMNLDGFGFQKDKAPEAERARIIIKGNSPEEVYKKGLELEQKKALQDKFFRTTDRGFQKALQYEAARLPAYIDYEGMEYYPIISSALDLFMEESTTIGFNGKMLNIYSNKERIKGLLEDFFYNIINVNVNLPFWVRNTVKYGDNFVLMYGEKKTGITHVKQMVNYEVERFERITGGKPLVKFKERMTGDEFNVFEIAHFRLLGDDKYLPYGSCLLSDSYVKTNKGIKKIQNIVKGDEVFGFDVKTQEKILSNVLDVVCNGEKQTYKISTQHNFIKATDNHKILTYDDISCEFEYRFVSELKINDKLVINNSDDYNEKIAINKSVDIKEHKNRIYDEFADDLKYVPDYVDEDFAKLFGFLLGDGNLRTERPHMVYFAYGSNNVVNEKYISLLRRFSGKEPSLANNNKYANGIMSVVSNSKALASVLTNMGFCGDSHTKRLPDWIYSCSKEIRKAFLEGFQDADGSTNIDKWNCKRNCIEISNYDMLSDLKTLIQSIGWKSGSINKRKERTNVIINGIKIINIADAFQLYYYESENKQTKISDINNRLTNDFIIEKIKSIELDEIGLVYDIYVDNENHNFYANNIVVHNSVLNKVRRVFRQLIMAEDAMLTYRIIRAGEKKVFKIDVGNIDEDDIEEYIYKVATKFKKTQQVAPNDGQIDYRFNITGNDEDYFLPVRNANTQTGIETLPGATNLDAIQDIEYLRDNLFVGLGIPKPFLSFQDASGAGKNMAQYDIRFSKKINRIQQAMIQELNKMAMIHLYLLGYSGSDISDFTLTLTNPSTQQDLMKAELLREKAQTYTELTRAESGIAAMSHTEAQRMLFNKSDAEIVESLKQQKMEKVIMQELADSPVTIKRTGLFADIDKRYGEATGDQGMLPSSGGTEAGGGLPPAGGTGLPPMGGGAPGGAPPSMPTPGGDAEGLPPISESSRLTDEEYNNQVDKLVYGTETNNDAKKRTTSRNRILIKENEKMNSLLNTNAFEMINDIDKLISKSKDIGKEFLINEDVNDTNFDPVEDIDVDKVSEK